MRRSVWIGFAFAALFAGFAASGAGAQTTAPDAPAADVAAPAASTSAAKTTKKVKAAAKSTSDSAAATDATAPDKPKVSKPKATKAMVSVSVTNKRSVALKWLNAVPAGSDSEPKKVIGLVKPDKKGSGRVARTKDCQYDLHGDYEDGTVFEAAGVDLCKSDGFNLVD